MLTSKLTTKGQLVIPKPIRDAFHLEPGTVIHFRSENSHIILEPEISKSKRIEKWPGFSKKLPSITLKELCEPVVLHTDFLLK